MPELKPSLRSYVETYSSFDIHWSKLADYDLIDMIRALCSWCSFSMMVKWSNNGLLQANDCEMIGNDGEMSVWSPFITHIIHKCKFKFMSCFFISLCWIFCFWRILQVIYFIHISGQTASHPNLNKKANSFRQKKIWQYFNMQWNY